MCEINEKIRSIRLEKMMTQAQVAELIGVERSSYAKYEASTMPSLKIFKKLCLALGTSADEILKLK